MTSTTDTTSAAERTPVDDRIDAMLDDILTPRLAAVRADVTPTDRWYGRLLQHVYDALADDPDPATAGAGAAAVELLNEYHRVRGGLIVQLENTVAHSLNWEHTDALLAGDALHAAAYSALHDVDTAHVDVISVLADTSSTMTRAFDARVSHASGSTDGSSFVEKTVGSLGRAAAGIGATLAGATADVRADAGRFGSGLSVARWSRLAAAADASTASIVPPAIDPERVGQHGRDALADATTALDRLAATTDATALRELLETTVSDDATETQG